MQANLRLSLDDKNSLLEKKSWTVGEAACYFLDYRFEVFSDYINEVDEKVRLDIFEIIAQLIDDIANSEKLSQIYSLEKPRTLSFTVSDSFSNYQINVRDLMGWANERWSSVYGSELPSIVKLYNLNEEQRRVALLGQKSESAFMEKVSLLEDRGIPITQLVEFIFKAVEEVKENGGEMPINKVAYSKLRSLLDKEDFKNLPRNQMDVVVTQLLNMGFGKGSSGRQRRYKGKH